MALLRTLLFNLLFYPGSILYASVMSPCLLTRRATLWGIRYWTYGVLALMRIVLGLDYRVSQKAKLPLETAIYACKHQSAWETIALWVLVPNPVFVIKKELYRLPVMGWWIRRSGCIALDRSAGMSAVKKLIKEAQERAAEGYNIIIFPEGTRMVPGETRDYLPGIAALYKYLKAPIVPIAVNSGLFWRRNAFLKKSGVIDVVFLEPLPAGRDTKPLLTELQAQIEAESQKLLP